MGVNILKEITTQGGGNSNIKIYFSQDTLPEGNVVAPIGSIYIYTGSWVRIFQKSANTDATGWRPVNIRFGTTGSRLTLGSSDIGTMFYDTTIGKPIWWNGSAYVDFLKDATTSENGLVKQTKAVSNITTTDATDLTTTIDLVNELKAKLNEKLTADRDSGQQAT